MEGFVCFFYGFFFCVFLPRKFIGLKAKVCFAGDMGLGFDSLLEIDYGGRTLGKNTKNMNMFFRKNNERNK